MIDQARGHREIEAAINEVARKRGERRERALYAGERRQSGPRWPWGPRERIWGEKQRSNFVEEMETVNVVGKVPKAFFRWLEEQARTDPDSKELLNRCFFEER